MKNLAVDDARSLMLAAVRPLSAETVDLRDAMGRTLAQTVTASRDQPPFVASAMDGWAVRAVDAHEGASLAIVGESAAGRGYAGDLRAGQAARIFTGAPAPDGAETVVIQENARRDGDRLRINATAQRGANLRPRGGDFRQGDILLEPGKRLDPWRISLAAAAGLAQLKVGGQPRVAILSTGDEIVPPGTRPGPHQIFNSGALALAALVERWGGEAVLLKPAEDDLKAIAAAASACDCDVVVTLGGASVGDHDLVKPALAELGLVLAFESLAMRPGKPTSFGVLRDGRYVLGLPGNPASALVCAELFLRPLLMALQGGDPTLAMITAHLAEPLPANGPREHWMRAELVISGGVVTIKPFSDQDSSLVSIFAQSDALLKRPSSAPGAQAGDIVEVLKLDRL